jgi:hypothetical protein
VGTPSTFTVTVNPRPTAPISLGDVTNCVGIANPPLSVSVPSGVSVEWHDSLAGGNFLGNGSSYTPTNTAVGVDTFYAQAIGLGGCASGSRTAVSLTIEGCSGLLSISLIDTNVVLVWYGNLQLCAADCSSGIPPLASWSILKTGAPGVTNRWTNSIQGSSFRLFQLRPQ